MVRVVVADQGFCLNTVLALSDDVDFANVLQQEPPRVANPDPRAHRQQPVRLDGARDTDLDRQREAVGAPRGDPRHDR